MSDHETLGRGPSMAGKQFDNIQVNDNARVHLGDSYSQVLKDYDSKCLQDLRLTDPRDDMKRIEQTKGGLLDDCYQWILDNRDFQKWRDDEHSRLLWIKGDPGKGKTMLLCGIINELSKSTANTALLSYFFCQATDRQLNSATVVLRGLIFLLLAQQPLLISRVRKKYDHAGRPLFEDGNASYYFSEILRDMLRDPCLTGAYIIVDALDECETGLPQLLDFIVHNAVASHPVKWIVSSRNRHDIELCLRLDNSGMRLSLELNATQVSHAVERYIECKVSGIASLQDDEVLQGDVRDRIYQKAKGTFLWVALVLKELQDVSSWDILQVLDSMPEDLKLLYHRMIRQIQSLKWSDPEFCRLVLSVVTLVYRPLHLLELGILSGLPRYISGNAQSVKKIVEKCGSFLTIREDYVYLIHQSAQEYLSEDILTIIFPLGHEKIHYEIFSRSLHAMSILQKDIYNLHYSGYSIDKARPIGPDPLSPLQYSCVYWVQHIQTRDIQLYDQLYQFLQNYFLYWLEALCWMGKASEGILAISALEALVPPTQNPDLYAFIHDAKRFVLYNRSVMVQAPLQLYCSSLIFAPEQSIVRRQFEECIPPWVQIKPRVQANWDATLQTLEGHTGRVNSVAFSHDSKLLASASDDNTARIWDVATGSLEQTLEGHTSAVYSVAFSHDSKLLASASHDKTVMIWDVATGSLQQTLEGHINLVSSVAFSHDSKLLASASYDETVMIWDTATGSLQQTLEGHTDLVNSIAFSHDSKLLATASDDKTVRIWDAATGSLQQTLEGHTDLVISIAFSHDSKLLASASYNMVRIWDAATGSLQQTLEDHTNLVYSVAFSHDSKLLASASYNTVRIWDAATGSLQQTLEVHTNFVNSTAFSHDSKLLASVSYNTVRIWDAATGSLQQTLEGHTSSVYSVSFSYDSNLLASASYNTVRIWNAATGSLQQTLEGHADLVNSIAFSHDSKLLASASDDKTVRIWDAATGSLQQTLEGYTSLISSVAFSHDLKLLASTSYDKTVRVWDTATGSLQQTVIVNNSLSSLSFNSTDTSLVTNIGHIKVDRTRFPIVSKSSQLRSNVGNREALGIDGVWVIWNNQNLLWLPPNYRTERYDISPSGSTIAMGCGSKVIIVVFSSAILDNFIEP